MSRVVFRCDASPTIGSGHVMRCAALAGQLAARGAGVEFVCRELPPSLQDRLAESGGSRVHLLAVSAETGAADGTPLLRHGHWLHASQSRDAADTISVIAAGPRPDWMVVDHYALDARWERALRDCAERIFAIDDIADREHDCDLLLDQNFYLEPGQRYAGRLPRGADALLGPRFALLRPEFPVARARQAGRDGVLRRLFVSFGSFDPDNETGRALEAITAAGLDHLAVDVVIGRDNPHRQAIEMACRARPGHRVHVDARDMAALMAAADLAIGAGGATGWERCCLHLPALLVSLADNQHPVARDLAEHGACLFLGRSREVTVETMAAELRALASSPARLREMGARAGELVDGHGTRRVADRLLAQPVRLRAARPSDCGPMHEWRNAEEIRRQSFDPAPIPLDTHRRWFERTLRDPDSDLLVGELDAEPVGILRYDRHGGEAKISVYLVPGRHGRGLGTALLVAGTRWLRERRPGVRRVVAEVKPGNPASLGAFANAGYRNDRQHLVLEL